MATKTKAKSKGGSKHRSSAKGKAAAKKGSAAKRTASAAKAKPAKKGGGATKAKRATVTLPAGNPLAAKAKFERDLQIRGEALPLDKSGHLPLDATHEIVHGGEGEGPKIERRRFKMF